MLLVPYQTYSKPDVVMAMMYPLLHCKMLTTEGSKNAGSNLRPSLENMFTVWFSQLTHTTNLKKKYRHTKTKIYFLTVNGKTVGGLTVHSVKMHSLHILLQAVLVHVSFKTCRLNGHRVGGLTVYCADAII